MKTLTLHSEAYRYIIASFKEWLQTLGYDEQTVYQLPNYIQEFCITANLRAMQGCSRLRMQECGNIITSSNSGLINDETEG